jgi:DNA-binding CsgD family transcriptional regulator
VHALPERDVAALAATTAELASLEDAEAFPPHVLHRLSRLVASDWTTYCELDRARERTLFMAWWACGDAWSGAWRDDEDEAFWRLRHQHPTCGYRERANEWTTARMISDFTTLKRFRRTEIWDKLYRDDHVVDWIDVGLRPSGRRTRMFLFARDHGCYDERDRLVLDLLQPHLQQRYQRVQVAAEAAGALVSLAEQADDPGRVVLCSRGGVIEFASPPARLLLARYLGGGGRVPGHVLRGLASGQALAVQRDGRRLTLRGVLSAGLFVLLLGEEDLRLDRLTPRQRAILAHVARGETDAQIGEALGIAAATVNKHLERIYERLGVHTRTAAAALLPPD